MYVKAHSSSDRVYKLLSPMIFEKRLAYYNRVIRPGQDKALAHKLLESVGLVGLDLEQRYLRFKRGSIHAYGDFGSSYDGYEAPTFVPETFVPPTPPDLYTGTEYDAQEITFIAPPVLVQPPELTAPAPPDLDVDDCSSVSSEFSDVTATFDDGTQILYRHRDGTVTSDADLDSAPTSSCPGPPGTTVIDFDGDLPSVTFHHDRLLYLVSGPRFSGTLEFAQQLADHLGAPLVRVQDFRHDNSVIAKVAPAFRKGKDPKFNHEVIRSYDWKSMIDSLQPGISVIEGHLIHATPLWYFGIRTLILQPFPVLMGLYEKGKTKRYSALYYTQVVESTARSYLEQVDTEIPTYTTGKPCVTLVESAAKVDSLLLDFVLDRPITTLPPSSFAPGNLPPPPCFVASPNLTSPPPSPRLEDEVADSVEVDHDADFYRICVALGRLPTKIVAICGATRSGKTSLVDYFLNKLAVPKATHSLSNDSYFYKDLVRTPDGTRDRESPDCVNFKALLADLLQMISVRPPVPPEQDYLFIDGHVLIWCPLLLRVCHRVVFLTVSRDICLFRRQTTKPVSQEYFDDYVWPWYEKAENEADNNAPCELLFLDSDYNISGVHDDAWSYVIDEVPIDVLFPENPEDSRVPEPVAPITIESSSPAVPCFVKPFVPLLDLSSCGLTFPEPVTIVHTPQVVDDADLKGILELSKDATFQRLAERGVAFANAPHFMLSAFEERKIFQRCEPDRAFVEFPVQEYAAKSVGSTLILLHYEDHVISGTVFNPGCPRTIYVLLYQLHCWPLLGVPCSISTLPEDLNRVLFDYGLYAHPVPGDGACFYRALAIVSGFTQAAWRPLKNAALCKGDFQPLSLSYQHASISHGDSSKYHCDAKQLSSSFIEDVVVMHSADQVSAFVTDKQLHEFSVTKALPVTRFSVAIMEHLPEYTLGKNTVFVSGGPDGTAVEAFLSDPKRFSKWQATIPHTVPGPSFVKTNRRNFLQTSIHKGDLTKMTDVSFLKLNASKTDLYVAANALPELKDWHRRASADLSVALKILKCGGDFLAFWPLDRDTLPLVQLAVTYFSSLKVKLLSTLAPNYEIFAFVFAGRNKIFPSTPVSRTLNYIDHLPRKCTVFDDSLRSAYEAILTARLLREKYIYGTDTCAFRAWFLPPPEVEKKLKLPRGKKFKPEILTTEPINSDCQQLFPQGDDVDPGSESSVFSSDDDDSDEPDSPRQKKKRGIVNKYKGKHPAPRPIVADGGQMKLANARVDEFIAYMERDYAHSKDVLRRAAAALGPTEVPSFPDFEALKTCRDQIGLAILERGSDNVYRLYQRYGVKDYECLYRPNLAAKSSAIEGFVPCIYDYDVKGYHVKCDDTPKYLFGADCLCLLQSQKLLPIVQSVAAKMSYDSKVYLSEGIYGCGKTMGAVRSAEADLKAGLNVAIMTATRAGAEDVCHKLKGNAGKVFVATFDSYLLNARSRFDVVYMDEALMVHAAYIDLICHYSQTKKLLAFGDRQQIPYITRVPNFHFAHHVYDFDPKNITFSPISLRSPQDVILATEKFYRKAHPKHKTQTTNSIKHSMTTRIVKGFSKSSSDPGFVTYDPKRQYLALYKADIKDLLDAGFENVMSVHQAQGKTFHSVTLCRPSANTRDFFTKDDTGHYVVAISRHTNDFQYCTVLTNDDDVYKRMILTLEKQNIADDILVSNAGLKIDKDPFRTKVDKFSCGFVDKHLYPLLPPDENPLQTMQAFYDSVFPGIRSTRDSLGFDYQLETNDLEITLPDTKVVASKVDRGFKPGIYNGIKYLSKLHTAQPADRPTTQKQLACALLKRNGNAPKNMLPRSLDDFKDRILPRFLKAYCHKNAKDLIAEYKANPVTLDSDTITDFLHDLKATKLSALKNPLNKAGATTNALHTDDISVYDAMIKRDPKNVLDASKDGTYQALQVIAASNERVNATFGGVFRELYRRFKALLAPNIYCHMKKSINDLENHLDEFLDPNFPYEKLEIDQGKFDKSQQQFVFEIERMMWQMLGMDLTAADHWYKGHENTTLKSWLHGIAMKVFFQRKSGDVTTCFGNTMANMLAIADCFDLDSLAAAYFVGDDSFIFLRKKITTTDEITALLDAWNFEGKIVQGRGVYFCSAFFVHDGFHFRVIPDPIKRIERLSKPISLGSAEGLFERWVSFQDLARNYDNAVAIENLRHDFRLRYSNSELLVPACASMVSIAKDYHQYLALFEDIRDTDPCATHAHQVRRYIVGAPPCSGKTTFARLHPNVITDFDDIPEVKALYKAHPGPTRSSRAFVTAIKTAADNWLKASTKPGMLFVPWTDGLQYTVKVTPEEFARNFESRKRNNALGPRAHLFQQWYTQAPSTSFRSFEDAYTAVMLNGRTKHLKVLDGTSKIIVIPKGAALPVHYTDRYDVVKVTLNEIVNQDLRGVAVLEVNDFVAKDPILKKLDSPSTVLFQPFEAFPAMGAPLQAFQALCSKLRSVLPHAKLHNDVFVV
jgi:hypothetical protein